ncbi:MAG: hypothetical protein KAV42_03885 [Candidatus Krumholzibacteria bacterium]|nr:hypothetical protein [Candidatus Krumholzibacteria bacterium]
MKKILMIVAALALFAGTVAAGPIAYIGLYTDASHEACDFYNPGGFNIFTLWTWVQPNDNGAMCAEYKVEAPVGPGLIIQAAEVNPDATVSMGSAIGAPGASICFGMCQTDWFWTFQIPIYSTDTVAGLFTILAHDDAGGPQIANCILPDYPIEPATVLNSFGLNMDCEFVIANDEASWGAIKSLISE